MHRWGYEAKDEQATATFGAALAEVLPPGTVVSLSGTLGAGKTRLVQAVAASLGVEQSRVTSPTFVLVQEYHGKRPLYHFDAYRLRDEDEFLALGPEEYFEGSGLVFIEWAERVASCLPMERVEISIRVTGAESRHIEVCARGEKYVPVLEQLRLRLPMGGQSADRG